VAEQYAVACEFWQYTDDPGEVAIELASPLTPESSVASSLQRSGPGLYHIALEVDDLATELDRLRRPGVTPLDAAPCRGAREGMQVAFLYLRAPAGFLVELVQYDQPRRKPVDPR
jgi:methylmalonyl-CoA/ethylmalonyl-CoA epimerase